MSADWSSTQRRCLDAMGYSLYRPVGRDAAPERAAVEVDERLSKALLIAAGLDPATVADAASWLLEHGMRPTAKLRMEPAAKRALWPRLRALRAGRAQP